MAVPFTYTGNSIYHRGPRQSRGGQVRGIAGGSEQFFMGVSGLVKKNLDCTVEGPKISWCFYKPAQMPRLTYVYTGLKSYFVCLFFVEMPIQLYQSKGTKKS